MVEGKSRSAALRLEFPCQEAPRMQPCHRHRRTPIPKCLGTTTANSESGRWRDTHQRGLWKESNGCYVRATTTFTGVGSRLCGGANEKASRILGHPKNNA